MTNDDQLKITLSIAGRALRCTIKREEEFAYREAARKLSNRIDYLYKTYPTSDYPTILTVAALEKALECEMKATSGDSQLTESITAWSDLIDRVTTE